MEACSDDFDLSCYVEVPGAIVGVGCVYGALSDVDSLVCWAGVCLSDVD